MRYRSDFVRSAIATVILFAPALACFAAPPASAGQKVRVYPPRGYSKVGLTAAHKLEARAIQGDYSQPTSDA
jgi:hypothetical protein